MPRVSAKLTDNQGTSLLYSPHVAWPLLWTLGLVLASVLSPVLCTAWTLLSSLHQMQFYKLL